MHSLWLHNWHVRLAAVTHIDNLLGYMADNIRWPVPNIQAKADILDQMDIANHHIQISPHIPRYRAKECQFGLWLVLAYSIFDSPNRWLSNP